MNEKLSFHNFLNLITPYLVCAIMIVSTALFNKINQIDEKIFKHLTNDEIHTPKSVVLTRTEFEIYQNFRNKQNDDLQCSLREIKSILEKRR